MATRTLNASATSDNAANWSGPASGNFSWAISGPGVSFAAFGATPSVTFPTPGTYRIHLTVRDSSGNAANFTGSIHINTPPTFTNRPPRSATSGVLWSWTPQATDGDAGDFLAFFVVRAPPGFTVSPAYVYSWKPSASDAGLFNITVRVDDGLEQADLSFTIAVRPSNSLTQLLATNLPSTVSLSAGGATVIPLDPTAAGLIGYAPGELAFTVRTVSGDSVNARVVTLEDGTHALAITGLKAGTTKLSVTVTDSSGQTATKEVEAAVAGGSTTAVGGPGADLFIGLLVGIVLSGAMMFI